jgi:polar amino acid transport system substrate-binding protein
MKFCGAVLAAAVMIASARPALADDAAALRELAPTGKLRVAIAVSPSPSALYVIKDEASGKYRGVAVDLGAELAAKLGVGVEYVPYLASGAITDAADRGVWDVTFMPYDATRAKKVAFGGAYHVLQSTCLVAPGSDIKSLAEIDRPGVRIAGVANTATFRAAQAAFKTVTFVTVPGVDAAVALMRDGKADAIALSRESLLGLAKEIPGARVLDGAFLNSYTGIWVPNGKPAALAYVAEFIEAAKASGAVRRAFDAIGLTESQVAPPGAKP